MKATKIISLLAVSGLVFGCQQEIADLTPPEVVVPQGTTGSANFTKYVSLGNSLTAGYQAGALFTDGQNNSYPNIMASQFAYVSTNDPFDQPSINSANGYYGMAGPLVLGRLILFDSDGTGPKTPSPTPSGVPGVPEPYNTADLPTAYTGDKSKLNNFGVPGIILGQALIPDTGNPASPAFNPLWARFASEPGVKSILQDAIAQQPTFFSFWLGNNDVLAYATSGGAGRPLTPAAEFQAQYTMAITALLAVSADTKGIVATIPNVTSIPFFTTVRWNQIALTETLAGQLTTQLANNYNAFLDGMVGAGIINGAERDLRRLSYVAGNNGVLIHDKTLTDLSPYMAGPYAGLLPYARARQTKQTDLITLSAGAYLGTNLDISGDGVPDGVNGVSLPATNTTSAGTRSLKGDDLSLVPTEIAAIQARTTEFNTIISNIVTANTTRLALADVNAAFTAVVTGATKLVDGMPVAATFIPPAGIFSEDGVHPNNRGSAYLAKIMIDAINAKFGATVPSPNLSQFRGTAAPVSPL